MDDASARARFAEARVATLGTSGPDGRPSLVPVCFVVDGDAVYSGIDAKPKTGRDLARIRNVHERGFASLLVHHWDEDWSRLWWITVAGVARVVDAEPEITSARALLRVKYEQYATVALDGDVIAVGIDRLKWWEGEN